MERGKLRAVGGGDGTLRVTGVMVIEMGVARGVEGCCVCGGSGGWAFSFSVSLDRMVP